MKKVISFIVLVFFIFGCVLPPQGLAQSLAAVGLMPAPGIAMPLSAALTPAYLKGMVIDPQSPFKVNFIVYKGDVALAEAQKKTEYTYLIKYFLAALAVPDTDQWVNLSPYEKSRIIPDNFGQTEMGRDLLAQDYLLKQISSSLINPDSTTGKKFWEAVYAQAFQKFGTTEIPTDTFNKVWIVPNKAVVYEKGNAVYVVESHLKVMLDADYEAAKAAESRGADTFLPQAKRDGSEGTQASVLAQRDSFAYVSPSTLPTPQPLNVQAPQGTNRMPADELTQDILREIIVPILEKEINEGKNFAPLRQVYSGMLLATWYKRSLKESILGKVYADQGKVKGIDQDPKINQQIYAQYVQAFQKGVFNIIREDIDLYTQELIPRKYFSGGMHGFSGVPITVADSSMVYKDLADNAEKIETARIDLVPFGNPLQEASGLPAAAISVRENDDAVFEQAFKNIFGSMLNGDEPCFSDLRDLLRRSSFVWPMEIHSEFYERMKTLLKVKKIPVLRLIGAEDYALNEKGFLVEEVFEKYLREQYSRLSPDERSFTKSPYIIVSALMPSSLERQPGLRKWVHTTMIVSNHIEEIKNLIEGHNEIWNRFERLGHIVFQRDVAYEVVWRAGSKRGWKITTEGVVWAYQQRDWVRKFFVFPFFSKLAEQFPGDLVESTVASPAIAEFYQSKQMQGLGYHFMPRNPDMWPRWMRAAEIMQGKQLVYFGHAIKVQSVIPSANTRLEGDITDVRKEDASQKGYPLTLQGYLANINDAQKRGDVIRGPGLVAGQQDIYSPLKGLSGANTRSLSRKGQRVWELILKTQRDDLQALEMGPGAGNTLVDMEHLAKQWHKGVAFDTSTLTPIASSFRLLRSSYWIKQKAEELYSKGDTQLAVYSEIIRLQRQFKPSLGLAFALQHRGETVFSLNDKPLIRRQYIGKFLSDSMVFSGEAYHFVYDQMGAFFYSFSENGKKALLKTLGLLKKDGILYFNEHRLHAQGKLWVNGHLYDGWADWIRGLDGLQGYYILLCPNDIVIVRAGDLYAPRILAATEGVVKVTENIYQFDSFDRIINVLSGEAAGQTVMVAKDQKMGLAQQPGGIDFASSNLDLQIRRDGQGVVLPVSQQNLDSIKIDGLVPIIRGIEPFSSRVLWGEYR